MEIQYKKQYVAVDVHYTAEGKVDPKQIYWPDGRVFLIDAVVGVENAASLKVGGAGIRYRVLIPGEDDSYQRELWFVDNKWFVEIKRQA